MLTKKVLILEKVEDQTGYCREIYKDKKTGNLYSRHIGSRYSKDVYVNHWNTFVGEPDCPLANDTFIKIDNERFIIERDEWSGWAIEHKIDLL